MVGAVDDGSPGSAMMAVVLKSPGWAISGSGVVLVVADDSEVSLASSGSGSGVVPSTAEPVELSLRPLRSLFYGGRLCGWTGLGLLCRGLCRGLMWVGGCVLGLRTFVS